MQQFSKFEKCFVIFAKILKTTVMHLFYHYHILLAPVNFQKIIRQIE